MGNILAESLAVLRPGLPPALFAPEILPRLWADAHALAPLPVLRVGLECRLGAGASQVDLQQCFKPHDGEPALLANYVAALTASAAGPVHPAWGRIGAFCAGWGDVSSPRHTGIVELWLELDASDAAPAAVAPSVFIGLDQQASAAPETQIVVETALEALGGGPLAPPLRDNLRRCCEACTAGAHIGHVGAMLSRGTEALRVNIKNLSGSRIVAYLERVGWPGPMDAIIPLVTQLSGLVDAMTVCLDVGARIYPTLGLECFLRDEPGRTPDWAAFLGHLVQEELCTPEKRDALMAWTGEINPLSSPAPWPTSLLRDSLLQTPNRFNILARRLNHVKVAYHPQRPLEAKAYLGFGRVWLLPDNDESPFRPQANRAGGLNAADLCTGIDKALAFLLAARDGEDWWQDFLLPAGPGDEWVTGYVGAALAVSHREQARQAAFHAWSLLAQQRTASEGWGYNRRTPLDADSTAWALRLARAVGQEGSERAQGARRSLEKHLGTDGGVITYVAREAIGRFVAMADWTSYEGWCRAHTCVTAAAASLLAGASEDGPLRFLRHAQREAGNWKGYWWEDDEYTTALAAEALAGTGLMEDQPRVQTAMRWASQRLGPTGSVHSVAHAADSAFATAWCVRTLALADNLAGVREPMERAVVWLLDHQKEDGSWLPSARLRVPPPDAIDPETHPTPSFVFLDRAGIFTTATVLSALEAARSRLENS